MSTITHEELATLTLISKLSEVLEKLTDKEVVKALKTAGVEKFKEADEAVAVNQKILLDVRDTQANINTKLSELRSLEVAIKEAREKLDADNKEFKTNETSLRELQTERLTELKDRERLVTSREKNITLAETEAQEILAKGTSLKAEYEEKFAKLKALTD